MWKTDEIQSSSNVQNDDCNRQLNERKKRKINALTRLTRETREEEMEFSIVLLVSLSIREHANGEETKITLWWTYLSDGEKLKRRKPERSDRKTLMIFFFFSLDFDETKRWNIFSLEFFFSRLTRTKLKQFYSQLLLNLNKQRKIMLNQDVELETLLVDKDNRKTFCSTWLFSINERKNNNQMADGYRRKSSRCFWWSESESMKNWVLSTCQNDGIDWIKRFNRSMNDQIVTSINRKPNNFTKRIFKSSRFVFRRLSRRWSNKKNN